MASSQARITRACAEKIKDDDQKNAKLKREESDDDGVEFLEILPNGDLRRQNEEGYWPSNRTSRTFSYGTARDKAEGSSKNFQIEAYDLNATTRNQVIELFSDSEPDEETLVPQKRHGKNIEEKTVQLHPSKRLKTSNSETSKDKAKETDGLPKAVCDQNVQHIESWFDSGDARDIAERSRKLTYVVSSEDELEFCEKDQSRPFHEAISSENDTALPHIHQGPPENLCEFGSSSGLNTNVKVRGSILESKPQDVRGECSHNSETSQIDIVSIDNGTVKISLLYRSSREANLDKPDLKTVTKEVENEYRKSFGIRDPDFSVVKLLEDICKRFSETATDDGKIECVTPSPNNSCGQDVVNTKDVCQESSIMEPSNANDSALIPNTFGKEIQISQSVQLDVPSHLNGCNEKENGSFGSESEPKTEELIINDHLQPSSSSGLKAVMKHPNYLQDITQGKENVEIPLLNDKGAMELPKFFYISKNIAYKDAYVTFSLSRISDENCCSHCLGDCLSSEIPCACATETRGEFAYTQEGQLKETFLDEAITMSQKPEKHHLYYCEDCPLENNPYERYKRKRPCRGHLMRKFIKECWDRCGCNKKKCSNRVVQRGITVPLEVFSTPEGKGWGLRSVKALKKGDFVCEYVGEIVTNQELHLRNKRRSGKEKHTYPVLLDADWGSERFLKDEEALCLDATKYGNCARFINHRCVDANLVEIPVEVETPDHHYYHVAFFATRNIEPIEELNWDYGIQFDDKNHPVKAFKCKCGSQFCRDQNS